MPLGYYRFTVSHDNSGQTLKTFLHREVGISARSMTVLKYAGMGIMRSGTELKAHDIVSEGDIMVAEKNCGCGSSREHAPIAIKASGISCVIASTFARIFYRNSINIGLPILECDAAAKEIKAGDDVEVDFDTGVITDNTTGKTYQAEPFPPFIQGIIKDGGLINHVTKQA